MSFQKRQNQKITLFVKNVFQKRQKQKKITLFVKNVFQEAKSKNYTPFEPLSHVNWAALLWFWTDGPPKRRHFLRPQRFPLLI
jgi:hypothetical protein